MDDQDFDYEGEQMSPDGQNAVISNQHHDEEISLSSGSEADLSYDEEDNDDGGIVMHNDDDDDDNDHQMMQNTMGRQLGGDSPPPNISDEDEEDEDDEEPEMPENTMGMHQTLNNEQSQSASSEGESEDGDDDKEGETPGGYNALDYEHLHVSEEIKELFQYIGRYKPHTMELETKLKPFIPDYIPAVGDIDEFIKVPRPDGEVDFLGLKVLDEPAAKQSDATVLNLQLRSVSKQSNMKPIEVTSVDHADKNPKRITQWIESINNLHKKKPPPSTGYSKQMPEIEQLMEEWPPEMEEKLNSMQLPDGDFPCDIKTFVTIFCNLLDIPVYNSPTESLHVMFTLFLEFKNNPFLKTQQQAGADMDYNSQLNEMMMA